MAASKENPIYSAYVVSGTTKYNITSCLEEIRFSDQKSQFAKSATLNLSNVRVNGTWLNAVLKNRDRIFIYADDGETSGEVWRGFIWDVGYKSSINTRLIVLKCYDNLIYCQESEESLFFASGKDTKSVMTEICNKWGIILEWYYSSITHSKLALRGALSDIITADILDLVKDRTGKKYVVLSEKDVMKVKEVGQNEKIYKITAGNNSITTETTSTMEGMVTKVVILGKEDKSDRRPVEATVNGDTATYGTLQKLINRDENTSLADAKKEGESILKESGKPKVEYRVECPDIPWIRKGDKVYVSAGNMVGYFIAVGIDRDINNKRKTMSLTMEDI